MNNFINAQNIAYTASNVSFASELANTVKIERGEYQTTIEEREVFLHENNAEDQNSRIDNFVYDLASIAYNPTAVGGNHGNGYQPYAKWVANDLAA
jgi:cytochrome b involved in lipid metabolism